MRFLVVVLLVLAAAPAFADSKKQQPKAEEISQADADKYLAFFTKLTDAIVQNKDNCGRMAAQMNAVIDANQDIIKKVAEEQSAGKKLPKKLEEKMAARTREMIPAMNKCGADTEVRAALKRIDTGKPAAKSSSK
jgi:hypothetical protein